jgi:hypothetical protein
MTPADITRMAQEAGFICDESWEQFGLYGFTRFANVVAKHLSYDGIHTCNDECQRPVCVAIRKAVQREREACAKVVEEYPHWIGLTAKAEISNAIRARGER